LDHDELVASETKYLAHAGRRFVQRFAGAFQRLAPRRVTELAVHALQMIDVHEHERHVALASPRGGHGPRQQAVELSYVPEPSQRIVRRQALLPPKRRSLDQRCRDVARQPSDDARISRCKASRRLRVDQLQDSEWPAPIMK
jgi:hypothetical protein